MVTRKDYDSIEVEAAHSVMLELVRLLAEYRDDIVVVGGWVPALLIPQDRQRHIGSTDVDLALNHRTLTGTGYQTICRLLEGRGYTQDKKQPGLMTEIEHEYLWIAVRDDLQFAVGIQVGQGQR